MYHFETSQLSANDSRKFIFNGFGNNYTGMDSKSPNNKFDIHAMTTRLLPDLALQIFFISYAKGLNFIRSNFMTLIQQMAITVLNIPY